MKNIRIADRTFQIEDNEYFIVESYWWQNIVIQKEVFFERFNKIKNIDKKASYTILTPEIVQINFLNKLIHYNLLF